MNHCMLYTISFDIITQPTGTHAVAENIRAQTGNPDQMQLE